MTKPGDVIIETWKCGKGRPWLILWVDYDHGEVCAIAVTTQDGYCGAVPTGHHKFKTCGAWATVQPLHMARRAKIVGYFDEATRRRVAAAVHRNLALTGEQNV